MPVLHYPRGKSFRNTGIFRDQDIGSEKPEGIYGTCTDERLGNHGTAGVERK